jgi:acid stress chaperone HdeB
MAGEISGKLQIGRAPAMLVVLLRTRCACCRRGSSLGKGTAMMITRAVLLSLLPLSAIALTAAPAHAVVLDLSTMSCKQFVDSSPDEIKMVLTWMDGWYKGDSDDAIIDTEVFVDNAKKFGTYCASHPTVSIVTAAEKVLGE